jgi:outer membrane protein assembly factor BamB
MTDMRIKTNTFVLLSLAALIPLHCACTALPVSKMVLDAEVSFTGRPDSVDIFDVDNDGHDEIILQQNLQMDRGDGVTYSSKRITVYNRDFHSVLDQVNTGVSGHCSIRRDPGTGEALFGIVHIQDDTALWSEFDISGNERNAFPLQKVVDRNGNGTWEGRMELIGWLDVNDDKQADAIFCLMAAYDELPRKLMAVDDEAGTILWEFQCGSITSREKIFIDDIDDDGETDILIGTTGCDNGVELNGFSDERSYLIALDRRGQIKWQRRIGGRFSDCRPTLVADIDQDGRTEILFQRTSHSERPRIIHLQRNDRQGREIHRLFITVV